MRAYQAVRFTKSEFDTVTAMKELVDDISRKGVTDLTQCSQWSSFLSMLDEIDSYVANRLEFEPDETESKSDPYVEAEQAFMFSSSRSDRYGNI